MRKTPLVIAAVAGLVAIQALGQTAGGLDIDAIKRRSEAMADDAKTFADQVKNRGEAFRQDAAQVRVQGEDNMARLAKADLPANGSGAFDFDEIIKGAGANIAGSKSSAPQFIAFASLSMPPDALRQLIADTTKAGGVVVFRGFPNNSMKQFSAMMTKVVKSQDELSNVGVDPRLFRAFNVQAVPTYIAVSSDFDLCSGFSCQSQVPPYDRMVGNVTVRYVLDSFAAAKGPGAGVASVALRNMGRAG